MPKKYIIANWKNHPESQAEAGDLLESYNEYLSQLPEQNFSLIVCPPSQFSEEAAKLLGSRMILGAQDTGALPENTRYIIVGHSDHRWKAGESDEVVNQKLKEVLKNNMTPVVCLGEKSRDAGFDNFLRNQTKNTFAGVSPDEISRCLIAYEPVWAISTTPGAKPDSPESALQSMAIIAEQLGTKIPMLYGGSITSANARDFLSQESIDGVLIGGASLKKEEFVKILSVL